MNQTPRERFIRLLLLSAVFLFATHSKLASAQSEHTTPATVLGQAEEAYQAVDYSRVQELARRGLLGGGATSAETTRFCVLSGMAEAFLGNASQSRLYFIKALAIQPTLDLERELSPKMREPYLEALGYWGTQKERIAVRAKLTSQGDSLLIRLVDVAQLARRVHLYIRVGSDPRFERVELNTAVRSRYALPRSALVNGFAYYVEVVDAEQNRLVEYGSEDEPFTRTADNHALSSVTARASNALDGQPERPHSRVLPIVLLGAGVAALSTGVYFHVRRERIARQWNGSECEQAGQTRIQQCGAIQDDRVLAERMAVLAYSAGAVLSISGAAMLLLTGTSGPAPRTTSRLPQCEVDVFGRTLVCRGAF